MSVNEGSLKTATAEETAREAEYYERVHRSDLEAFWRITHKLVPKETRPTAGPFVWKWEDVYPLVLEGGEVWPLERGGERRVLILRNPALGDRFAATNTIYGGLQIVMPGEVAPCHRHWASAIRFVIQGNGIGYTGVEGEKLVMEDYDLVLTPGMDWHDHRNDGDTPIVWLDVLDVPLLNLLELSRFQPFLDAPQRPIDKPDDYSERVYGDKLTRPVARGAARERRRPYIYKWNTVRPALMALEEADPYEGFALEYINPVTDGPTLTTFTCLVHRLAAGCRTRARRRTASALFHVIEGEGYSIVGGTKIDWRKGDSFAVPHWLWCEHANPSGDDAILFSANDSPVMRSLGVYFEEEHEDGSQESS